MMPACTSHLLDDAGGTAANLVQCPLILGLWPAEQVSSSQGAREPRDVFARVGLFC